MTDQNQHADNIARLDATFADGGIFVPPIVEGFKNIIPRALVPGPGRDSYYACSVQTEDNKKLYLCFHLSEDGELDRSFGVSGFVTGTFAKPHNSIGLSPEQITLVDVEGEKRILLLGGFITSDSVWRKSLVRLHLNGEHDKEFGEHGLRIVDLPPDIESTVTTAEATRQEPGNNDKSLSILPGGKILLIQQDNVITRLNSDGSPDTSFNKSGFFAARPPVPGRSYLTSLMRTMDGALIGAGSVKVGARDHQALFVKLSDKGELDTSFDEDGYVLVGKLTAKYEITNLVTQPNQRILGIGRHSDKYGLLISLEPNGKPNIQFNGGEPLESALERADTRWLAGKVLPDGKFLVAGLANDRPIPIGPPNVVAARFYNNGTLDMSFGNTAGYWRFANTSTIELPHAFMDGKILFVAWLNNVPVIICGLIPDTSPAQ